MASTKTTKDTKAEAEINTGMLPEMEVEETFGLPLRGKSHNSEVTVVKNELIKCQEEGTIRSFQNVEQADKEKYARLIRKAGDLAGIKPATRHDRNTNKLYWGPESVMKELSAKGA